MDLADSVLLAQVPEARLVPEKLRRTLIARVLNQLLQSAGTEAAAMEQVELELAAAFGQTAMQETDQASALPEVEEMADLGIRGYTVKGRAGVSQLELSTIAKVIVGQACEIKPFPGLKDTYTITLTGKEKPLVSEAFDAAAELQATGKFEYAEPNLAVPASGADEATAPATESGLGGPGEWDRDHPQTRSDCEWSLNRIHAKDLWEGNGGSRGMAVVIGHIDTGYTLHPELKPSLDRNRDYDYWDDDADAQDPLKKSFWDRFSAFPVLNPGHGTGTGSVIASPQGKQSTTFGSCFVTGTAPEATLIPYRATPSVIIVPGGSQDEVARAIVGAADAGVDVISMSLGSPWQSRTLREAVDHALERGVIICAAAGNIVAKIIQGDRVTYPAKYSGVVGVAACDYDYAPWNRSCRGPEVDIAAPGTDVWRAVATKDLNRAIAERGSGTSFAVATVAGMAACWLGRHGGRRGLLQHYGKPSMIPAAFMLTLQRHAKIPLASGDPAHFGQGIIHGGNLATQSLPTPDEVSASLQQLKPQAESTAATLESITPAGAETYGLEGKFEAWTGLSLERLSPKDLELLTLRVASDPRLLQDWWKALSTGTDVGDAISPATTESTSAPSSTGRMASIGILRTASPSALAAALETMASLPEPTASTSPRSIALQALESAGLAAETTGFRSILESHAPDDWLALLEAADDASEAHQAAVEAAFSAVRLLRADDPLDLIPTESAEAEQSPGQPINSTRYADLKDEYVAYFNTASIRPERAAAVRAARDAVLAGRVRYTAIAREFGAMPWWFVGLTHLMEASCRFTRHQHNGDSLNQRTVNDPAGRPLTGSPPFTWETSARDAHRQKNHHLISDWSLSRCLYELERYNGFGYRPRRNPTPYLWSFTNRYSRGKYTMDHGYNPNAVSQQCGAAAALRALVDAGHVTLPAAEAAPRLAIIESADAPSLPRYRADLSGIGLRSGPDLAATVIGGLLPGDLVNLAEGGDPEAYWLRVCAAGAGLSGYVARKYLTPLPPAEPLAGLMEAERASVGAEDEFAWIPIARGEIGQREISGARANPRIVEYLQTTTLGADDARSDETAWCSAFANWCIEKADIAGTDSAWALDWRHWGRGLTEPRLGCIVVFHRDGTESRGGHVGFFLEESGDEVLLLGGNQSNSVKEDWYPKNGIKGSFRYRLAGYRIPS